RLLWDLRGAFGRCRLAWLVHEILRRLDRGRGGRLILGGHHTRIIAARWAKLTADVGGGWFSGGARGGVVNQTRNAADDDVAEDPRIHSRTNWNFSRGVARRFDRCGIAGREEELAVALECDNAGCVERGDGAAFVVMDRDVRIGRIGVEGDLGVAA